MRSGNGKNPTRWTTPTRLRPDRSVGALRRYEVHFPVLVAQLHESTVASRQYLSIRRIRLATEHQACTILRSCELDIGATCRRSQAQQHVFRISRRTVRHLRSEEHTSELQSPCNL